MSSVGGMAIPKKIGTMVLKIRDDNGIFHTEKFKDTYLIPQLPKILISPVQWSEQIGDDTNIQYCMLLVIRLHSNKY